MIYSLDLLPVVTKPTRITNHTATLIDHIYTNNVNRLTSGIVTVDISDQQSFVWLTHLSKSKIDKIRISETKGLFTWNGGPRSSGVGFFCFTLWGTQNKETYPTRPGSPTPCKQGLK